MRLMNRAPLCLIALIGCILAGGVRAADELLLLEQDYKLFEPNTKEGPNAKDTRQILYITQDALCIDEFGSGGNQPTETYLIDLKNQRIVNLDHSAKEILVDESFAERRARIVKRKKDVQRQLDDLEPGKQRDRVFKMFQYMMDDKLDYITTIKARASKVDEAACDTVSVSNEKDVAFTPLTACLHPDLVFPYDNSEVLFLLKIVSERVAGYLKEHKQDFSHLAMEMHLQLPEGGKLDTKVVSVKKSKLSEFDPKSRALGDPFKIPDGYAVKKKLGPKVLPPASDKPKEKAD